jgi:flagellar biosynthesis/type III secretory pathway protein FliH
MSRFLKDDDKEEDTDVDEAPDITIPHDIGRMSEFALAIEKASDDSFDIGYESGRRFGYEEGIARGEDKERNRWLVVLMEAKLPSEEIMRLLQLVKKVA